MEKAKVFRYNSKAKSGKRFKEIGKCNVLKGLFKPKKFKINILEKL